jgi:hypothetical protein
LLHHFLSIRIARSFVAGLGSASFCWSTSSIHGIEEN